MLKSNCAKFYKFDFFSIIYIFVTEHICDGFGTIITCVDSNQILQILNATFGMSDSQICPVSSQSKSHVQKPCRKDVTKRVQLQCKGRTFCIFRADAVIFGALVTHVRVVSGNIWKSTTSAHRKVKNIFPLYFTIRLLAKTFQFPL